MDRATRTHLKKKGSSMAGMGCYWPLQHILKKNETYLLHAAAIATGKQQRILELRQGKHSLARIGSR